MPVANDKMKTVARLAMGTALIAVVSGCDGRFGRAFDTLTAPVTPSVQPVAQAPAGASYVDTFIPAGAPTYSEPTQAANVQTFESIYGAPVTGASSGVAAGSAYTIPSYNDGTVSVSPLSAPSAATYAAAPLQSTPTFGVATVDENLSYGDTLTSTSYEVAPVVTTTTVTQQFAPSSPYSLDTGLVQDTGFDDVTYDVSQFAPAPATIATESYSVIEQAAPSVYSDIANQPGSGVSVGTVSETGVFSSETFGGYAEPEILSNQEAISQFNSAPFSAPVSAPAPQPSIFDEPTIGGQFQVLPQTNNAIPTAPSAFDTTEATWNALENGTSTPGTIVVSEIPVVQAPLVEPPMVYRTVAGTDLKMTPTPRRKSDWQAAAPIVVAELSPVTAPSPRQRPVRPQDIVQASLKTPLPQPRPNFKKPMAVATTAGSYVSVGELPAQPKAPVIASATLPAPADLDKVMVAASAADDDIVVKPAEKSVQVAALAPEVSVTPSRKTEPAKVAVTDEESELSGTSWRLASVGGVSITGNTELHFDGSSGFAGGQGPCNSYGGEFMNVGQGNFKMANIFTTDLECPSLDTEKRYIDALSTASTYDISNGFSDLVIRGEDGKEIATFRAF